MTDLAGHSGTFVLGPGRCGSTMVSDIVNLHPEIFSLFEFFSTQGARSQLPRKISRLQIIAYRRPISKNARRG